ncbi:MAG: hypothetical protein AB7F43_09020 [Bacteriovoracia bacterium]
METSSFFTLISKSVLGVFCLLLATSSVNADSVANTREEMWTEISKMYEQIKAKEAVFISPSQEDLKAYPEYIGKKDMGIIRLLPRETFDGKLSIRGGAAYYSFGLLSQEYNYGSDIELSRDSFSVGFAGCDFGFFVKLENQPLEAVSLETPGVGFLRDFEVPSGDEDKIRQYYYQGFIGIEKDGYTYKHRTNFSVGDTFALRSVVLSSYDILVALKVVRVDSDNSVVLIWKKLKDFPISVCSVPNR